MRLSLFDLSPKERTLLQTLEIATNNLDDVIWMTDLTKNKMVYISKGYEKVWGRTTESLLQEPLSFLDAIHEDDRQRVIEAFPLQPLGRYSINYRIKTPKGETKWILDKAYPIKNEKGIVYMVVGIASDVTLEKQMQLQIERERASSLYSSKMATLGEMAAGVAHEINNPLSVVVGKLDQIKRFVLSGKLSPSEILSEIEKIEKNADRITKIVSGLRTFSRDASHDPMVEVDLNQLILETLELCRERFKNYNIDLRYQKSEEIKINCRPGQIVQVLLNLLSNAHDAVQGSAGAWTEIKAYVRDQTLFVRVSDSGHGVPKEYISKIMQPFFTTKDPGRGTGLGLSISKNIIENHGGRLVLDTQSPNTCFVICLPISAEASASSATLE